MSTSGCPVPFVIKKGLSTFATLSGREYLENTCRIFYAVGAALENKSLAGSLMGNRKKSRTGEMPSSIGGRRNSSFISDTRWRGKDADSIELAEVKMLCIFCDRVNALETITKVLPFTVCVGLACRHTLHLTVLDAQASNLIREECNCGDQVIRSRTFNEPS
jgi:hypothetical protein